MRTISLHIILWGAHGVGLDDEFRWQVTVMMVVPWAGAEVACNDRILILVVNNAI